MFNKKSSIKYTKDFEKYWNKTPKDTYIGAANWENIKIIAFRAWKAGQRNIKMLYDLTGTVYKKPW